MASQLTIIERFGSTFDLQVALYPPQPQNRSYSLCKGEVYFDKASISSVHMACEAVYYWLLGQIDTIVCTLKYDDVYMLLQ